MIDTSCSRTYAGGMIHVLMLNPSDRPTSDSRNRLMLDSSTNLELLAALKSNSSESWPVFVRKYTRLLQRWCAAWNASPEDADDVVQETLLELYQKINDYRVYPNATFRAWLRKVAYYQYLRILKKQNRHASNNPAGADQDRDQDQEDTGQLQSALICESFLRLIDTIADQELVEIACRRISSRISSENWNIFCRKELEGVPGKTVADEFGITTNSVDVITFRVRKMIRAELEMLDPEK